MAIGVNTAPLKVQHRRRQRAETKGKPPPTQTKPATAYRDINAFSVAHERALGGEVERERGGGGGGGR